MKKTFKIIGIVVIIFIALLIILPFFFKGQIAEIVKKEANKNLNATLNFQDVGLNFFSHFPNLSLSLDGLTIVNKAPFEGDTLVSLNSFQATVDVWSVIGGDKIKVEGITLNEPKIFVYSIDDSTANYNITKPGAKEEAKTDTTSSGGMTIALKRYSIENGSIAYLDQKSNMTVIIRDLNHEGSGDFSSNNFTLETNTTIGQLSFEKSGIKYLNKANLEAKMNIAADMQNKKFTFKENEFRLNNLKLNFNGSFAMPDSNISMDINFASADNDFKDIISLIPAVYSNNFDDIKSSGKMSLKGEVKGTYSENHLPSFNINLNVDNGKFQYPKLPTPVNNVVMQLDITNSGGTADNTIINMKKFHMELGSEPFDATLVVKTPTTAPYVDTKMKGRINLANLKNAIYMEGVSKLEGIIDADFQAKGTMANADTKTLENISANGNMSLTNFVYAGKQLKDEVKISKASLNLTPKQFTLNNFAMTIGKNDLSASGQIENMISYVLSDGTIKGNLNLSSNYFDLNPFMTNDNEAAAKTSTKDTSKLQAVAIPDKINFTMNANFKKIIFDNLNLTDVKGTMVIANQKLTLKNVSMNTLGGTIVADGYYAMAEGETPNILFNLNIKNLEIKDAYENFVTVSQIAPMAKYVEGKFNSSLSMTTKLDNQMMPIWDSFNGKGSLNIPNAAVKGFKPFEVVGDKLNIKELQNPSLNNINTTFTITKGRFYISPFSYTVLGNKVTLSGSNGLDKSIDYVMSVNVPATKLKNEGNKAISSILKKDVKLITANSVEVKANIKGTVDSPTVTTSAGNIVEDTKKQVTEEVKKEVNKQIEQKKEEVKKEVESKVDTVKKKVEEKVKDKLKDLFKKKF